MLSLPTVFLVDAHKMPDSDTCEPLDIVDPLESLCDWASLWPHNVAYIFTNHKGEQVDARTFEGLRSAATEIAHFLLHTIGCNKGR